MNINIKLKNDLIEDKCYFTNINIASFNANISDNKIVLKFSTENEANTFYQTLLNNEDLVNNYANHDNIYMSIELRERFENGYYFNDFDVFKKDNELHFKGSSIRAA